MSRLVAFAAIQGDYKFAAPACQGLTPPPYLGPLLDAGVAALLAFEIEEALRYLTDPGFYCHFEDIDEAGGKYAFHQESSSFIYGLLFSKLVTYHLKVNGIYPTLIIVSATAMGNNPTLGKGGQNISWRVDGSLSLFLNPSFPKGEKEQC